MVWNFISMTAFCWPYCHFWCVFASNFLQCINTCTDFWKELFHYTVCLYSFYKNTLHCIVKKIDIWCKWRQYIFCPLQLRIIPVYPLTARCCWGACRVLLGYEKPLHINTHKFYACFIWLHKCFLYILWIRSVFRTLSDI